jgi:hypothetical protein
MIAEQKKEQKNVDVVRMVVCDGENEGHNIQWKTEKVDLSRCIIEKIILMTITALGSISLFFAESVACFLE